MRYNMIDRKKKVDLEKMTIETLDETSKQLGNKVNLILMEALEKSNAILNIYGLKLEMGWEITPISTDTKGE